MIFTISPHSRENTEGQREEGTYPRPQSNMVAKVDCVSSLVFSPLYQQESLCPGLLLPYNAHSYPE